MKFNVFLDESGNTGHNYLDHAQPFYILAGWLIKEKNQADFNEIITTWEADLLKSNQTELKSNRILKRDSGITKIADLVRQFGKVSAYPTYCIQEKRYSLCTHFVECFARANPLFVDCDSMTKIKIANIIYNFIDNNLLSQFGHSFSNKNTDAFNAAVLGIKNKLNSHREATLALILLNTNQQNACKFLFYGDNNLNSPNLSVFHSMLNMLQCHSEDFNYKKWNLFHDNTKQFEDDLKGVFDLVNNGSYQVFRSNNNFRFRFGEYTLENISFVDSKESPAVRASDYFSGTLNYLLKKIQSEPDNDVIDQSIYRYFLEPFVMSSPANIKIFPDLYFPTISDSLNGKILNKIGQIT